MKANIHHASILLIAATLSACSGEGGKQMTSTTAMGAAIGIVGGPIGIAVGAVLGAASGAVLPESVFDAPSPSGGAGKQ